MSYSPTWIEKQPSLNVLSAQVYTKFVPSTDITRFVGADKKTSAFELEVNPFDALAGLETVPVATLTLYNDPVDTSKLDEAVAAMLSVYPQLAGRMQKKVASPSRSRKEGNEGGYVVVPGDGIEVREVTFEPCEEADKLLASGTKRMLRDPQHAAILRNLTCQIECKFASAVEHRTPLAKVLLCHGQGWHSLSLCISHQLVDGFSYYRVLEALGHAMGGGDPVDVALPAMPNRDFVAQLRETFDDCGAGMDYTTKEIGDSMYAVNTVIPQSILAQWKREAMQNSDELGVEWISAHDAALSRVTESSLDSLFFLQNIRGKWGFPADTFGNCFIWKFVDGTSAGAVRRELQKPPQVLDAAKRELLRQSPHTYFNSWWNLGIKVPRFNSHNAPRDHLAILPGCLANFAQVCECDEGEAGRSMSITFTLSSASYCDRLESFLAAEGLEYTVEKEYVPLLDDGITPAWMFV